MLTVEESNRYVSLRQSQPFKRVPLDTDNPRPPALARIVTHGAAHDAWIAPPQDRLRGLDPSNWATRALNRPGEMSPSAFVKLPDGILGGSAPSPTPGHVPESLSPGKLTEHLPSPPNMLPDMSSFALPEWLPLDCIPLLREGVRLVGDVAVLRRSELLSRVFADEARACGAARRLLLAGRALPANDPRRILVETQLASFEHARRVLYAARRAERLKQTSVMLELGCIIGTVAPLLTLVRGMHWGVTAAVSLGAAVPFLVFGKSVLNIRHYAERWVETRNAASVTWERARRSTRNENRFALSELAFYTLVATGLVATSGFIAAGLIHPIVSGVISVVGVVGATVLQTLYGSGYGVPSDVAFAATVFASDTEKEALDELWSREEKRHQALRKAIIHSAPWPRRCLLTALSPISQAPLLSALFGWQLSRALDAQGDAGASAVMTAMQIGCDDRIAQTRARLERLMAQQEACETHTRDDVPAETHAAVRAAAALQMTSIAATAQHLTSLGHVQQRLDVASQRPAKKGVVLSAANRWVGVTQRSGVVVHDTRSFVREALLAPQTQARANRQALRWSARHARHAGEAL